MNIFLTNIGFLILAVFLLGALGSLFAKGDKLANWIGSGFAAVGCALTALFASVLLLSSIPVNLSIPTFFPFMSVDIYIDSLSAFFMLVISVVGFACSVYGLDYMKHYFGKYSINSFGFFYNLFIASLLLVVTANNALYFLMVWEVMSLTSYFLVIYEHKEWENTQAGILYFVMTHLGTIFITITFLLLFIATGSFNFQDIKFVSGSVSPVVKNLIFLTALIGFGTKAGIIPLHIWLPRAHPAAPSQVSALMSGVMIKTAIYMMIRLFVDILSPVPVWWGIIILLIAAVSSLLGVLYALAEHDIKRLLAYHSVENIGIILMGLGSGLIFLGLGMNNLATIGIVAALFHTMNHAVFKSLLFLAAGSVVSKTHTRNMEEYGGLIKKMPYTAFFFLIGAISISALPPFNGFASEWLTFQSLIFGIGSGGGMLVKVTFVIATTFLAFTGGLAVACFVKAFGVSFLARPRSYEAKKATESGWSMQIGMALTALLTLILGVFSAPVMVFLTKIVMQLKGLTDYSKIVNFRKEVILLDNWVTMLNMPTILVGLILGLILTWLITYVVSRQQKRVFYNTWECGAPGLTPRMEITSTAFARSLIVMFGGILRPTKQNQIEYSDADSRYFSLSRTVTLSTRNVYEEKVYRPIQSILHFLSEKTASIQSGNLNQYLSYIFVILALLLIWARYY